MDGRVHLGWVGPTGAQLQFGTELSGSRMHTLSVGSSLCNASTLSPSCLLRTVILNTHLVAKQGSCSSRQVWVPLRPCQPWRDAPELAAVPMVTWTPRSSVVCHKATGPHTSSLLLTVSDKGVQVTLGDSTWCGECQICLISPRQA